MRATFYSLMNRVYILNDVLGRPVAQFSSKVGDAVKFSIGHITLTHNVSGYTLEEQTSEAGAVTDIVSGYTPHEMDILLTGIMRGITLRHEQTLKEKE